MFEYYVKVINSIYLRLTCTILFYNELEFSCLSCYIIGIKEAAAHKVVDLRISL